MQQTFAKLPDNRCNCEDCCGCLQVSSNTMTTHQPKNIKEFEDINKDIRRDSWSPYRAFFRGQSEDWPIVSGINRNNKFTKEQVLLQEKNLIKEFCESKFLGYNIQNHIFEKDFKYAQKWSSIFQAQHIGLKTRLTDWTETYEHALSFALQNVNNNSKIDLKRKLDAVLWVYKCPYNEMFLINFNKPENHKFFDLNPFDLTETMAIKHMGMSNNGIDCIGENKRLRQDGSFLITCNKDFSTSVENIERIKPHIEKIIINPELKNELLEDYLKPGLANYINYKTTDDEINDFKKLEEKIKILNAKHFD